jgi:cytosine/adenosine deaminase-related metal-dependent hydrolase
VTAIIVRGKYVVTGPSAAGIDIVRDGAVLVRDDAVEAVGPFAELTVAEPAAEVIGGPDAIVIPGLVNSHHHGWGLSTLQFGVPDDRLEPWLIDLISMPIVDPYLDTMYSAMKLIRSGVTSVQHSGFTRDPMAFEHEVREAIRAYRDIGLRVLYAVQVRDQNSYAYQDDAAFLQGLPPSVGESVQAAEAGWGVVDPDHALELAVRLQDELSNDPLVTPALCAEGPEWCSAGLLAKVRATADASGMRLHLHCLESPIQRAYLEAELGQSVLEYLDSLAILGPDASLGHAVWLSARDIELCAARGVVVCHCPSSNLRLRNGILPLAAYEAGGVTVALGVDSSTINDDDDFLQEMRLAARLHRLPNGVDVAPAPGAADVFRMATVNGAAAMGLSESIGQLAPGMKADLVTLDFGAISHPYLSAAIPPLDAVVYRAKRGDVRDVLVNGKPVLTDGRVTTVDEADIEQRLAGSVDDQSSRYRAWRDAMKALRPHVADFFEQPRWPAFASSSSYAPNGPCWTEQ